MACHEAALSRLSKLSLIDAIFSALGTYVTNVSAWHFRVCVIFFTLTSSESRNDDGFFPLEKEAYSAVVVLPRHSAGLN